MRIIGAEIRLLKQKDATKGKKKTMEVPNHQASFRGVGSKSGLKRWVGHKDNCNKNLPRTSEH